MIHPLFQVVPGVRRPKIIIVQCIVYRKISKDKMSFQDSPTSGPTTPFSEYSSGDFDPDYECDAPQFVDLLRPDSSIKNKAAGDDSWFGIYSISTFLLLYYNLFIY